MDVVPVPFRVLRILGLWHENPKPHCLVKYVWRPFNVLLLVTFAIALFSSFLTNISNVNDFTECLFVSLSFLGCCLKLANFLARHSSIVKLLSEFRGRMCQPRDDRERRTIESYERIVAYACNGLWAIALLSGFTFSMMPVLAILAGSHEYFLPFKSYEFIDKTKRLQYWLLYAHQVTGTTVGILLDVALDFIFVGFLLLTCAQIDLCCRHLVKSCNDVDIKRAVEECVKHQLLIWRIVREIEALFMMIVVLQIFLSLVTICTSVYNLSQVSSGESVPTFIYFGCMLSELFCHCWFGNELKLKSTAIRDAIYNSDWTTLKPSNRKSLHIIMMSCHREINISFHGLCALNIEIFVWVLKMAYSAYNLLKTVEK